MSGCLLTGIRENCASDKPGVDPGQMRSQMSTAIRACSPDNLGQRESRRWVRVERASSKTPPSTGTEGFASAGSGRLEAALLPTEPSCTGRGFNVITLGICSDYILETFSVVNSTVTLTHLKNTREWTEPLISLQDSSCHIRKTTCPGAASQPDMSGCPSSPSQSLVWGQMATVAAGCGSRPK